MLAHSAIIDFMKKYKVIIPENISPYPESFEVSAAVILLRHFKNDIKFIAKSSLHTPDIIVGNIRWEIKSPIGGGKRTIQHQIHRALAQSDNIVFDARRIKLRITKVQTDLSRQAEENHAIKRLVLIKKDKTVVIIK